MAQKNMNWVVNWQITINAVPQGAGPMSVPTAQALTGNTLFGANSGAIVVPCTGTTPTQANFNTALSTGLTNQEAWVTANLTTLQNWNSGSQ